MSDSEFDSDSDSDREGAEGGQVPGSLGVSSPAFQGLLWTQALTATNDNVFRWFVIGIGKTQFEPESYPMLLAVGSAFFLVPYILFASIAGWLGDRFRKSRVILTCKFAEIAIMALGVLAVSMLDGKPSDGPSTGFFVLLAAVFLMGTQSALFAPSKMGTIPELLNEKQISAGNGIFALTTLSATIVGTGIGGWLSDVTTKALKAGESGTTLPAMVMIGIAVVGTGLAFLVRSLPAANKSAKFPISLIGETIRDIVSLSRMGPLFRVALGIIFFWSIAGLAQLNIDVFSEQSGGLLESHRTPLLIAVTLGIGIGSAFAGYLSAGRIRLSLVSYGALGIAFFCGLLFLAPMDFITDRLLNPKMAITCLFLAGLGVSAGVFDVPLASYLQHYSPIEKRGSILAATNCLAFSGILILSLLFMLLQWPVRKGSLDNLPASMTRVGLAEEDQVRLDHMAEEYERQWNPAQISENVQRMKQMLQPVPINLRPAALTELVFVDAIKKRAADISVSLQDYANEFPDDARQIKNIVLQSRRLPLLTARQIFLLMGLITTPVFAYALRQHKRLTAEQQESTDEQTD